MILLIFLSLYFTNKVLAFKKPLIINFCLAQYLFLLLEKTKIKKTQTCLSPKHSSFFLHFSPFDFSKKKKGKEIKSIDGVAKSLLELTLNRALFGGAAADFQFQKFSHCTQQAPLNYSSYISNSIISINPSDSLSVNPFTSSFISTG